MKKIFLFALLLIALLQQSCKESIKDTAPAPTAPAVILGIGSTAPDFSLPNLDGQKIKLSSFKGKIILLDFWASWCEPCREENPHLMEMYKKFNSKNFDIISVSLDYEKKAWADAITSDSLIWTNISDLKGFNSKVVSGYNIKAIPATYLLDKEGKIIAIDLRGQQLEDKLEEILK